MSNKEKLAKEALTWLQETKEFAQEQAPLLVEEIIAFGFYSTLTSFLVSLAAAGFCIYLLKSCVISALKCDSRICTHEFHQIAPPVFGFLSLISILLASVSGYYFLMVTFAPRLYVLQELKGLVS